MSDRGRCWLTSLLVALFALAVFVPTLDWGLPSRESDKALFGDRKPWTGREILQLLEQRDLYNPLPRTRGRAQGEGGVAIVDDSTLDSDRPVTLTLSPDYRGEGTRSASSTASSSLIPPPSSLPRGADVDANPILDRSKPVILNDTDAKRAEIVQRYRLMSKQPDEFIQFKALAEMSQRQGISKLDPRLYQYGGLWIYPVGALVRGAMAVGYIERPPVDVPAKEFYLDHPEVFGKFYVVARAYSTFWGVVAALAIVWITRRLTTSQVLASLAAAVFILLPVTRTAAHEAKPHLAGAALCLCAVIAATRYVEGGRRRLALLAGALCGAAMAMVISMVLSLAVLPVMAWLRWRGRFSPSPGTPGEGRGEGSSGVSRVETSDPNPLPEYRERGPELLSLALSLACAGALYALTNPFLLYNAVFHPEILKSNLGNSTAMYGVGDVGVAFASALRIAVQGMTLGGVILSALSVAVLIVARIRIKGDSPLYIKGDVPFNSVGWLLAAPVGCVLVQFILLAAGKPAEYARFGLVVFATAACLFVLALGIANVPQRAIEWTIVSFVIIYIASFFLPAIKRVHPTQWRLAVQSVDARRSFGKSNWTLALSHEPAPWSVMPLNLFRDQLILTKPAADPKTALYDVYLYPSNLSSQVGFDASAESVDWAKNRTQMILGSLPTTRPVEPPPTTNPIP